MAIDQTSSQWAAYDNAIFIGRCVLSVIYGILFVFGAFLLFRSFYKSVFKRQKHGYKGDHQFASIL